MEVEKEITNLKGSVSYLWMLSEATVVLLVLLVLYWYMYYMPAKGVEGGPDGGYVEWYFPPSGRALPRN